MSSEANHLLGQGQIDIGTSPSSSSSESGKETWKERAIRLQSRMDERDELDRKRQQLDSFRSIERPSQAGSSDNNLACTRQVLGLEVVADDPCLVKVLKNLCWNYLREKVRQTILVLQINDDLRRGICWEDLQYTDQKRVRDAFVESICNSGACSLPFFHSAAAPLVQRFSKDWPANEMIKTVLRDQRTKARQVQIDELVINTVYNMHIGQSQHEFPSHSQTHTPKSNEKRTVGRPPLTDVQKAAGFIPPSTQQEIALISHGIRHEFRYMKSLPKFTFTADGSVIIPKAPRPPPVDEATAKAPNNAKKGRSGVLAAASTNANRNPTSSRQVASAPGSSQQHRPVVKQTARRLRIIETDEDEQQHRKKRPKCTSRQARSNTPLAVGKGKGKQVLPGNLSTLYAGYHSDDDDSGRDPQVEETGEDESEGHEYGDETSGEEN
ncbi:hypothetical protein QFC22_005880 [Naganishia vaughanmartiniae]|uniref:Uncharacterized protein n=1 Tax=Naganishia vaughanmartiniae TaxID=1424756 RepID=A0ACC2WSA0_9TREE|nr:hypothetical protein QFC22_005880 [Naganishia vaughanmartiniae]